MAESCGRRGAPGQPTEPPGRCNGKLPPTQHDAAAVIVTGLLTNRRSRGPCRTEALIVDPFVEGGRWTGMVSGMAEGAIESSDNTQDRW